MSVSEAKPALLTAMLLASSVLLPAMAGCRCASDRAGAGTGAATAGGTGAGSSATPSPAVLAELPPGLAARGFAGSAACTGCHEELAQEYAATGHARSAWAPEEIARALAGVELPATVEHPA
ncbi:MAG: hypothetical protein FJ125_09645, partial [Deltaproteobacteria bacterium]|nr:hypothetical protein [Deltaproteobacteria bacterium]